MTSARAKQILREVWGQARLLSAAETAEIEQVEQMGELCINTLLRIAGLPAWDSEKYPAFSEQARRYFGAI